MVQAGLLIHWPHVMARRALVTDICGPAFNVGFSERMRRKAGLDGVESGVVFADPTGRRSGGPAGLCPGGPTQGSPKEGQAGSRKPPPRHPCSYPNWIDYGGRTNACGRKWLTWETAGLEGPNHGFISRAT